VGPTQRGKENKTAILGPNSREKEEPQKYPPGQRGRYNLSKKKKRGTEEESPPRKRKLKGCWRKIAGSRQKKPPGKSKGINGNRNWSGRPEDPSYSLKREIIAARVEGGYLVSEWKEGKTSIYVSNLGR